MRLICFLLLLTACPRGDKEKTKPARLSPTGDARARPDTNFHLFISARILASYVIAADAKKQIVDRQQYYSKVRGFVFTPGQPAVARFRLPDGRGIDLAMRRLRRVGAGEILAECKAWQNWIIAGRTAGLDCGELIRPQPAPPGAARRIRSYPWRLVLRRGGAGERIELEIQRMHWEPRTKPLLADHDRAEPISDRVFETGKWKSDAGSWRAKWAPGERTVTPHVERRTPAKGGGYRSK